ncbi:MAG: hypothetical protein WC891_08830 [Actinomycetota bacterium]|jgi:hypothetical protein
MSAIDWKGIVKSRDDCLRMSAVFEEGGLPRPSWRSIEGIWIPEWSTEVDQTLVEKIARADKPLKATAAKASPSPPTQTETKPHTGGWRKGHKRKGGD